MVGVGLPRTPRPQRARRAPARGRLVAALAVALLGCALTAGPAAAAPPLVALYHLEENPASGTELDSSGNGLNGTVSNPMLAQTGGRFGFGVDFTARGRISVAGSPLLETPQVSVVAWIRYKGTLDGPPGIGAGRTVIAKGADACAGSSWALTTGPTATSGLTFSVWDGSPGGPTYSAPAGNNVWDGNWHAVTGTYDGSNVRLYVDGQLVGSPVPAQPPKYNLLTRALSIGDYPDPNSCAIATSDGSVPADIGLHNQIVDEVQIYSRALSATEIARLHAATGPAPPVLVPDPPSGGGGTGGGSGGGGGAGGGTTGGGGEVPGGGAGGAEMPPPTGAFNPRPTGTFRGATSFSALGSAAADGSAISKYEWDFNGDGRYDIGCGGATKFASHVFTRPGRYDVTLRVTDRLGQSSTVHSLVDVALALTKAKNHEVSTCEQPLGSNQADTPGCVKTFSFGIVEVNGRGGPDQCFTVEARAKELAISKALPRAAAAATFNPAVPLSKARWYHATIKGPVALNGLPVPLPNAVQSEYDSGKGTISLGTHSIVVTAPGGQRINVADVPLDKTITPKVSREYPRPGSYTLFAQKLEGKLAGWGGLKRGAGVEILLVDHASIIKLSLKLPDAFSDGYGRTVEGWVSVRASNADGFQFEGAQLGPVQTLFMGPLQVNDLFFKYQRTNNIWSGGANFQLLGVSPVQIKASPPPPDYGFGLREGKFDHAGGGVAFPIPPRPQLFPGVGLKEIGGAIGVNPLRFTGRMAIDLGGSIDIDGSAFVGLATPSQPYDFPDQYAPPGLEFLGGRRLDALSIAIGGKTSLEAPVIGNIDLLDGHVFYKYPDYVEFGGGFDYKPVDRLSIKGGVNGFAAVTRRMFDLEGDVTGCADIEITDFCVNVGAVVSTKGIGFCAIVPVPVTPLGPTIPVWVRVGYKWGDKVPGFALYSCDLGPYKEQRPQVRAAQAGSSFSLGGGLPSAMVRVVGRGGVPAVTITAPGGKSVAVPQTDPASANPDVIGIPLPEENTLLVALKSPAAGRWTVAPQAGSVPLDSVASAAGLAAPSVKARVTGHGARRFVEYTVRPDPGQTVTFVEKGPETYHVLGTARGAHGRLAFTPDAGRAGPRQIVAQIERDGVITANTALTRYTAPPARRPGRVRGLRVRRRGTTLVVGWQRVAGAAQYQVSVRRRNAPAVLRITRGRSVRIGGVDRGARGTVLVGALRADRTGGPQAAAAIPRG